MFFKPAKVSAVAAAVYLCAAAPLASARNIISHDPTTATTHSFLGARPVQKTAAAERSAPQKPSATTSSAYGSFYSQHAAAAGSGKRTPVNFRHGSNQGGLTAQERRGEDRALHDSRNGYLLRGSWQKPDFPLNGAKRTYGKLATDSPNLSEEDQARRSKLSNAQYARAGRSSTKDRTGGVADVLNADHGLTINKHTGVAHYPDGSPVLYHGAPAALATEEGEIYDNLELVKEDPKKFQEQVYNHVSKDVKEGRGIQKGFFATTDPLNALNYARPWNNSRSGVQKVNGFIMRMKPDRDAKFAWAPLCGGEGDEDPGQVDFHIRACNNPEENDGAEPADGNGRAAFIKSADKDGLIRASGADGVRDLNQQREYLFVRKDKLPEVDQVTDLEGNVILESAEKIARHVNKPIPTSPKKSSNKMRATEKYAELRATVDAELTKRNPRWRERTVKAREARNNAMEKTHASEGSRLRGVARRVEEAKSAHERRQQKAREMRAKQKSWRL